MKKEIATTQTTEVAMYSMNDFGVDQVSLSQQDVVIPKILTMQGLSKAVVDGKAKFGDFIDSLSEERLGDMKSPLSFIPFHMVKKFIISKFDGKEFKYDRVEMITAVNDGLPYEDNENGTQIRRQRVLSFYCILPQDTSIPYVIDFKGMSAKAGRVLATQMFVKNRAAGKVPPAKVMELSGEKTQNDKGVFVVLNTKIGRDSTNDEIGLCLNWYKTIASNKAKVHEESEAVVSTGSVEAEF